jgi:hypothetical protein
VRTTLLLVLMWAGAAVALRADESLVRARHARLLLGSEVWARTLEIAHRGTDRTYPRRFHALVFEYAGLLWFYYGGNGTQSFSLHLGRVEEEKREFGPLLRDILPAMTAWREVDDRGVTVDLRRPLANGCWIESVAALRARLAAGERVERPRLLSFWREQGGRFEGHTVLAYERGERLVVYDPAQPRREREWPRAGGPEALEVARSIGGPTVRRARELPLAVPVQAAVETAPLAQRAPEAAAVTVGAEGS